MANRELTHDELWDDSALVNSWNDAFEEYKKYHSLAQKGEKVEITQKPESKEPVLSKAAAYLNANGTSKPSPAAPINFAPLSKESPNQHPSATATVPRPPPAAPPGLASVPQALIGGAQNEDLKNIMMSWYYAGYYTGLYEGQQKAWTEMQESMQAQQQQQEGE
ncbi:hypothetical protein CB0940_05184 [Cercospora beticola]|uniref:Survival Motor Neuron Gemin2-binding domain-containing protein n=1 Tax=Cercospora beticola TaxID=122368 RepID=A0A2G5HMH8_CERBT|nr:hypothetical protein CB0940_05184 [Cercospora beticola]PIA93766.1 hypothetical protein CB0940_05184 [Cercospora beticola]WPB02499.1 hypothetical protein RHO25_007135 [Cercospora beticola]CAK1362607.1 unnamed protein product [Cercospora beticola]